MGVWRYVFRSLRVQAIADNLLQDVWFALARQAANSGFGPLKRLESKEQAQALLEAIEQPPFAQREAFLLQAEAGMDVQDIATTTGVSF